MHYTRIAAKLYNTPLLLAPDVANTIGDYVQSRISGDATGADLVASGADRQVQYQADRGRAPYSVEQGIAIIEINGELVNRGAWIGANSGLTSYEGIIAQLKAASTDKAVAGIMMVLDTPGGEASGINDITTAMRRTGKPVWAIANTKMASGGMWIGVTAQRLAAVADATVGSIGVVWMHNDRSAELASKGQSITVIQAGSKKTQFSSLTALSDDARAKAESMVGEIYSKFVGHVAESRGISIEAVRATEADVFTAAEAKQLKLIDSISTVDEFHAQMVKATRNPSASGSRGNPVSGPVTSIGNTKMDDITMSQADFDAAINKAKADGTSAGVVQERTRIKAVLDSPAAATRPKLASTLAFAGDISAETSAVILASAAEEAPVVVAAAHITGAPANLLAAAMTTVANPAVGASVDDPQANKPAAIADKPADQVASQLAEVHAFLGHKTAA